MKVRCFKCKGTGRLRVIDPALAILTIGVSALFQAIIPTEDCDACDGYGYLES